MTRLLLDTHTLIWLAGGTKLGPLTLRHIHEADSVFVSALSILELRLKHAAGKLPEAEAIIASIPAMGCEILNLTEAHTQAYRVFNQLNKDPFDNALISIACAESLHLITADSAILSIDLKELSCIDAKT